MLIKRHNYLYLDCMVEQLHLVAAAGIIVPVDMALDDTGKAPVDDVFVYRIGSWPFFSPFHFLTS